MKFQVNAADLNDALDVVSIVTPRPPTPQGKPCYLFIVRGENCYVYSRDSLTVSRAVFPIINSDGDGSFIYPAEHVAGFRYLQDEVLEFETFVNGDTHVVKYTSRSGAESERTSYDPRLLSDCDKDIEESVNERSFPVALLRESISLAKPFLAKANDGKVDDHYKTLQIFDASNEAWAKGDGSLYAADGVQAFYFQCDAFKGKPLAVHTHSLASVVSFLSKAEGEVTVKTGQKMTFVTDSKGRVLGWQHHTKTHQKYSYYALKNDKFVFDLPVRALVNAAKFTATELDEKRDKIRLSYNAAQNEMTFTVIEGNVKFKAFPVPIVPKEGSASEDFSFAVNLYHFIELMESAKGDRLEFRVTVIPADERRPKAQGMLRTIDEFLLDKDGKVAGGSGVETQPENTYRCRVTRFVSSKD